MSSVPNATLGRLTDRGIVRLFLPELYRVNQSPAIEASILKQIYDNCLRPLVLELIPEAQARWPLSYDSATRQSMDTRGRLHFPSVDLPTHVLRQFGPALLKKIQDKYTWGRGAFYGTELRGTKGATAHDMASLEQRIRAENEYLGFLDYPELRDNEWWADLALEIMFPGANLQWRGDSHAWLLRWLFPSKDGADIESLLLSSKYNKHLTGGLVQLAGFTLRPGQAGLEDQILYVNVYTTDKTATYQLHKGLFRDRAPSDTLPFKVLKLKEDVNSMSKAMAEHSIAAWGGAARVEVRVPIKAVRTTLTTIPNEVITNCVAVFSPSDIWYAISIISAILSH